MSDFAHMQPDAAQLHRQRVARAERREQVDAGVARERLGHGDVLGRGEGIALVRAMPQAMPVHRPGRRGQQCRAIGHQRRVGLVGAVPFQHGEFRMVQRRALAVAPAVGDLVDALLAGGEQRLHGELGTGVQKKPLPDRIERFRELHGQRADMRLHPRRNLQRRRLDLDEIARGEEGAQRHKDLGAHQEGGATARMVLGLPHGFAANFRVRP